MSKSRHRNTRQQAKDRLRQQFRAGKGTSKHADKKAGKTKNKIYSDKTFKTYKQHAEYFADWLDKTHPGTTIKKGRKYAVEWLQYRETVCHESPSTLHLERSVINKLYQKRVNYTPPPRHRADFTRSRNETAYDAHFSAEKHSELVEFGKATGCRRQILQRLRGRDLWTREQLETLKNQQKLRTDDEKTLYRAASAALSVWGNRPEGDYYILHWKDKGGKTRFAPIIGPHKGDVVKRMQNTVPDALVWDKVPKAMEEHSYRATYASNFYDNLARPIDEIPYDKVNRGSGRRYQSDVYHCRADLRGVKLDKRAMKLVSKALGHERLDVIAADYLWQSAAVRRK